MLNNQLCNVAHRSFPVAVKELLAVESFSFHSTTFFICQGQFVVSTCGLLKSLAFFRSCTIFSTIKTGGKWMIRLKVQNLLEFFLGLSKDTVRFIKVYLTVPHPIVYLLQGWYIVTYALGIYLLNLFIAFLTPKIDPAIEDTEDGPSLPTKANEEFRPFMRRLPEFKFWYSASKSILIGLFCTLFDALNIPVFWPILVMYFIILFTITMKRQIKHMIKYKYIPFTHGKAVYKGKEDSGKEGNHGADARPTYIGPTIHTFFQLTFLLLSLFLLSFFLSYYSQHLPHFTLLLFLIPLRTLILLSISHFLLFFSFLFATASPHFSLYLISFISPIKDTKIYIFAFLSFTQYFSFFFLFFSSSPFLFPFSIQSFSFILSFLLSFLLFFYFLSWLFFILFFFFPPLFPLYHLNSFFSIFILLSLSTYKLHFH
ncbi:Protein RER1,Protein RER1A,Protein RER1 homolog,Protein RER1C,Protein rer1,Protein RER1D,Protein RER1B [Acanthosepion pharaonis]|uniref:Protein RER1,Protein RER1A,Protein RER1 homolog,Protein RER1C,Protein rer1,Protein RER1D,Protein RER1B n=1 Tax=Acanthosepion pharaonis TaxID=158019 RepID=A0A812CLI7_ACAPH|nr:Protein RER1,Protein RER1A,Protein RER1 homolog,Protein RER1C,Protein rer1,Protein RER1D,Protein RER1B [Sepia pharaonis]